MTKIVCLKNYASNTGKTAYAGETLNVSTTEAAYLISSGQARAFDAVADAGLKFGSDHQPATA